MSIDPESHLGLICFLDHFLLSLKFLFSYGFSETFHIFMFIYKNKAVRNALSSF